MSDNNMVRLTGLWKNKTKTGESFLAGAISPPAGSLSSRILKRPLTRSQTTEPL